MTSAAPGHTVSRPVRRDGWRLDSEAEIPGAGRVGQWRHDSGATHLHAYADVTGYGFGLTVRTEATDDLGAAHVLEHLIGSGSRRYPTSSPWYTSMFRGMASFLNGFTETGRTSYTFVVEDPDDYDDILRVLLDGIYHPLLGEREFLREGCRHMPGSSGRFSGIVYNEMLLKRETERQWVSRLVAHATDPAGFGQYRHEGSPHALPGLAFDDCCDFYRRWYRPRHMHSFSSGPVLDTVLDRLDTEHQGAPPVPETACRDIPSPIIGPTALAAAAWRVVRAVFPEPDSTASWRWALGVRRRLRAPGAALVIGPQLTDGRLELLVGFREDSAAAVQSTADLLDRLIITEPVDAGSVDPAELVAHRQMPYATLPGQIRWGLELAGIRTLGMDPLRFAGTVSDQPLTAGGEVSVLRVAAPAAAVAWSAERAAADHAMWQRATVASSAACLPIRPLHTRTPRALAWPEVVTDRVRHVRRPGPPAVYLHVRISLRPGTAYLTYPVRDFLLRRLGSPPLESGAARVVVRDTPSGSCLADLLLPAPAPGRVHRALGALAASMDVDRDEAALHEVASAFIRRRSAALLSSPGEFARRAAAARLSAAGAAAEVVDGLTGVAALQSALKAGERLLPSARELIRSWAAEPTSVLVMGAHVPENTLADDLPAYSPGPVPSRSGFPVRPVRPDGFSERHGVTCRAWSTRCSAAGLRPTLLVLTEHLHRRYMHAEIRENRGAYAVGTTWDLPGAYIAVWSEADPDPAGSLAYYAELAERMHCDLLSEDDLLTAQLMAVQAEERRRRTLAYLAALADLAPDRAETAELVQDLARVDTDAVRAAAAVLATDAYHAVAFP